MDSKRLYNRLKNSAKKRGIPFDLTISDINNISFPLTCPILGIPLRWNYGRAGDDSYSFDRIDSNLGYTFDNIVVISMRANRLKNDANSDELKAISEFYNDK